MESQYNSNEIIDIVNLPLTDIIDIHILQNIQDAFASQFDIPSIILDVNGTPITQPSCISDLCNFIKSTEKGMHKCVTLDALLIEEINQTHKPIIRRGCVLNNIISARIPIEVQGTVIAIFSLGQIIDHEINPDEIEKFAAEIGLDKDELLEKTRNLKTKDQLKLTNAINFLQVLIEQLSIIGFQNLQNKKLLIQQKEYEKKITEQNELLRLAFENEKVAWWDWDYDSGIVKYSPNKATMLGYLPNEFPSDVHEMCNYIHSDDYDEAMKAMREHLEGKTPYYDVIYRIRTKDNNYRYYYDYGKVIERHPDGKPKRINGIVYNIDQQKQIENQLQSAIVKAEESDKLKSAFLRNISHEIRTPMNAIVGFTDLLLESDTPDENKLLYSNIIHQSTDQLLNIIENIISISHIETNQTQIRSMVFNPNQLIEELFVRYDKNKKDYNKDHIKLIPHVSKNVELKINSDFSHLNQIFRILLDNSLKFTNEGSIEFGYHLSNNTVKFFVQDSGIGISEDKKEFIIKSFVQADEEIRLSYGGMGLGLSIASGLLKLLGSQLNLTSEINKGTLFEFCLPLENQSTEPSMVKSGNNSSKSWDHKTLLVAEDEEFNYLFIESLLQDTLIKIIRANDGEKAVEAFQSENIDIVLMDLKMPNMDGFEATSEIRRLNNKVPIIAQTAFYYKREDCLMNGFTDFIYKPFSKNGLIKKLAEYIDK